MTPSTPRRRRLAGALLLTLAAIGITVATAAAAHAGTVEKSVPIKIYVSGTQHTEWHTHSEMHDGCTDGTAVYDGTGSEDLGFKAPDRLLGTMSTVRDDDGMLSTVIDLDPVDPRGVVVATDANTNRRSASTLTTVGGHESYCGGSDADPEPSLPPDCGTKEHLLWVKLTMDAEGKLRLNSYDSANKDPFRRCSTPALYTAPKLLPVDDGTQTSVTGSGSERTATISGRATFHQALPGGEAVTTIRWRVVLARYEPDREDEELRAAPAPSATTPAPIAALLAPPTASASQPATAPIALRRTRQRSTHAGRRHRARAHRRASRHHKPPRRS